MMTAQAAHEYDRDDRVEIMGTLCWGILISSSWPSV